MNMAHKLFSEQRLVALAQKEWVPFLQTMDELVSTSDLYHMASALAVPNLWTNHHPTVRNLRREFMGMRELYLVRTLVGCSFTHLTSPYLTT